MIALMPSLARPWARNKPKRARSAEPEWWNRYRQLYGSNPPPWRMGNDPDTVIAWCREHVARYGCKPALQQVMDVFQLPKSTAWRRWRCA